MPRLVALLLTACLCWKVQAHCYIVHGPDDRVLYRSLQSPVDLSRPLAEQVRAIWPGGHLVIGPVDRLCTEFDQRNLDQMGKVNLPAQQSEVPSKSASSKGRPASKRRAGT